MPDLSEFIADSFAEHAEVVENSARALPGTLKQFVEVVDTSLRNDGTILVCGNGGSAADAQHFVAELVCRFRIDRGALRAVALTTDTSALTAIGNDYGYDQVFARQVEALARKGDVLVAISTSGNSQNVLEAADTARKMGCTIVGMTGADGGRLAELADILVTSPSSIVARIQEVHEVCLHIVADAVERIAVDREELS
ncbi:MAG: D-sedoheptulose 7-phosphate isomerase [bacterium]|nr:D-sedoheptulose 7-phosphate isomerase [bacterium]